MTGMASLEESKGASGFGHCQIAKAIIAISNEVIP
ncbi:hypothetical protein MGSAQ_002102 [marine sediment metagenome]|uniref:Uncharacterized protein n=1 Tax=marine sediment metagenome TaxID=412755 RepID=A0A1B6NSF5_9ZZZZ